MPAAGKAMVRAESRRALLRAALTGAAGALAAGATACGGSQRSTGTPSVLRVGLVPNQAPEKVKAQYQALRIYLADTLSMPVELFVATDYSGVVEAMANERLDLAYFGGLTYVQAERRAGLYPIVTEIDRETGTTMYYSAIVTRSDGDIKQVEDIRGRRFAFGDINSTSGSLYPRLMLDQAGIRDFVNPRRFLYTGGHDATTLAVANGTAAAGGVEKRIMRRLIDQGAVNGDQLRVVQEMLVEGYPWCVRSALDGALAARIADAFVSVRDAELLRLMRAERYARVSAEAYEEIRREARRLGLVRS